MQLNVTRNLYSFSRAFTTFNQFLLHFSSYLLSQITLHLMKFKFKAYQNRNQWRTKTMQKKQNLKSIHVHREKTRKSPFHRWFLKRSCECVMGELMRKLLFGGWCCGGEGERWGTQIWIGWDFLARGGRRPVMMEISFSSNFSCGWCGKYLKVV